MRGITSNSIHGRSEKNARAIQYGQIRVLAARNRLGQNPLSGL